MKYGVKTRLVGNQSNTKKEYFEWIIELVMYAFNFWIYSEPCELKVYIKVAQILYNSTQY